MKKNEFEKDLEIDIDNLEVEAMMQPGLYFKYASLASEAKRKADLSKMNLGILEADLAKRARLKPKHFGINKITNDSIKEAVASHVEYKIQMKKMIISRSRADLVNKAQEAFEQRKRMIEMLITLQGRDYFASPNAPHTSGQINKNIKEKKGKKAHENVVKKLRKRKGVESWKV